MINSALKFGLVYQTFLGFYFTLNNETNSDVELKLMYVLCVRVCACARFIEHVSRRVPSTLRYYLRDCQYKNGRRKTCVWQSRPRSQRMRLDFMLKPAEEKEPDDEMKEGSVPGLAC